MIRCDAAFLLPVHLDILSQACAGMQVWQSKGVEGVYRFLMRAWRLISSGVSSDQPSKDQLRLLHATIKRVCPFQLAHDLLILCLLPCGSNYCMLPSSKCALSSLPILFCLFAFSLLAAAVSI